MWHGLIAILVVRGLGLLDPLPSDMHDQFWDHAILWAAMHPVSHLRAEFDTPAGPLPFVLTVSHRWEKSPDEPGEDGSNANKALPYSPALIRNGSDTIPYRFHIRGGDATGSARAWLRDDDGSLQLTGYGSGSCTTPSVLPRHFFRFGTWKTHHLKAVQVTSADERFMPLETAGPPAAFAGRWLVAADGAAAGVMEFRTTATQPATGDIIGTDGAVTRCEGRVDGDLLRLSSFDGKRAVLLRARMGEDGSLKGDWWDSERGLVTWTGQRD